MCGNAGLARIDGQDLGPDADALLALLADTLHHRGPDDRECLRTGPVGLAFTRLSLVDPEDGSQPLISDDGNLVLIANGEVYNHRELAAQLPAGTRLRTGSDCEVLLYLYRQHGLDFLRNVRGMFGLILWDRARNQLILARDRFGIKPLYYHRNDQRITLSSEVKGLFADPATPRSFDWERSLSNPFMSASARFGGPEVVTWFEGVDSVPAATILRIDLSDGRTHTHRYWEMPTEAEEGVSAEEFIRRYGDILEHSVQECATADTELGLFLSGGIDSAAVLALAAPQLTEVHTFTALSGGTQVNGDAEHASWLARTLGVPNHQVVFDRDHVPTPEEWCRLVWLAETPMTGPEIYYKHELHRFARAERPDLRGMLLGAASDEFNGGYSPNMSGNSDWQSFVAALRHMDRATRLDLHPGLRSWWSEGHDFFSDEALTRLVGDTTTDVYRAYVDSQYAKVQQYNLWHEDRTAAGSGIEARVPFLDHRLVELTAVIPARMRPQLLWDKQILREAMRGRLPARIADRPKGPFFYGSGTWHAYQMLIRLLRRNDSELVDRALSAPGADLYLDGDAIRHRLAEFGDGVTDAPAVEMLMRVVNMGLLAEMTAAPPRLAELSAGPVRVGLSATSAHGADTENDLFSADQDHSSDRVLALSDDVQLLTDAQETWFLLHAGQIEYVLEQDSPILRVLVLIDGTTPFDEVLAKSGVRADEVRSDLNDLFGERLLTFSG
ncbi:asparagine synthase (glutamine-hydrolyzing) [Actinophytocola gossypii]|uniref:asparagine synthase (glutamine-hydrolyzing) n=1 Tax=Actinophytocola gossypii TaxID=2812003 RepID=A0ABT2J338_9PSEU|nr:asparagine synthase (glutamine-hydrolyzing) [Actinophytocola gossypii]MCT2582262.1 asparagine synthase (glutamine-hydrolyzing) [Actinophytocola gossypii]